MEVMEKWRNHVKFMNFVGLEKRGGGGVPPTTTDKGNSTANNNKNSNGKVNLLFKYCLDE